MGASDSIPLAPAGLSFPIHSKRGLGGWAGGSPRAFGGGRLGAGATQPIPESSSAMGLLQTLFI